MIKYSQFVVIETFSAFQFAPEEWIYRAGEMANEMFFVASGAVEELSERDKVISTCADTIEI